MVDEGGDVSILLAFRNWMTQRGFNVSAHKHLKIMTFSEIGRGMVSRRDIESGETLMSIPESLLITTSTVLGASDIGRFIKSWALQYPDRRLSPLQALCVFLMSEKLSGPNSPWEPYLTMLPSTYTTPVFWPTSHSSLFQRHIKVRIEGMKLQMKEEYEKLKSFLDYLVPTHGKAILQHRLFLWAWYTVNTRSVYVLQPPSMHLNTKEDCCALVPFLDFLNHSFDAKVKGGFNYVTRTYDLVTLQNIPAKNQVFICYGSHDNVNLMLDYGFVLSRNPHSCVEFFPEDIMDCCETVLNEKLRNREASIATLLQSRDLTCTWDGPSWNLIAALKRLIGEAQEPTRWQDFLEPLLQALMTKRLTHAQKFKDSKRFWKNCAASMMFSVIIQEEIDILRLHLENLIL